MRPLDVVFVAVQRRERITDFAWVAICCIATFLLKLWANGARFNPGHGDTAYYYHVAENLFAGRGFVCDYVWSFLENPSGKTPAPSNAWWMPGPSILCALGMWVSGGASYVAAKVAMAAATSFYPAVVWWTAKALFHDRMLAARAALLAVAFHLFIDQPSAPLSHGPYGVIVGTALVLLSLGPLTMARGAVLGLLVALGHYFRGDALTLFGTAGFLALFRMRRDGPMATAKPMAVALGVYILAMLPWFIRNIQVFGSPMAPGPGKAMYLRDYYDWFALPDRLNATRYWAGGAGEVFSEKAREVGDALWGYVASYFDPTIADVGGSWTESLQSLWIWVRDRSQTHPAGLPPPWMFLRHLSVFMAFLTFAGLAVLALAARRRGTGTRWIGVYSLHSLAEIVFYAVLFTGVSNQSYISSMFSLYPMFVVGMAAALDPVMAFVTPAPSRPLSMRSWAAWILVALLALANALGVGAYLRISKGPEVHLATARFRALGKKLRESGFRAERDKVMLLYTWDLYGADRVPCVRIPDEPLGRILETAKRTGATWLLVGDRPTLAAVGGPRRAYRLEVYETLTRGEYFWHAFDFPELNLHAVRISQKALDNPWQVLAPK
jgi:hypothetical protein